MQQQQRTHQSSSSSCPLSTSSRLVPFDGRSAMAKRATLMIADPTSTAASWLAANYSHISSLEGGASGGVGGGRVRHDPNMAASASAAMAAAVAEEDDHRSPVDPPLCGSSSSSLVFGDSLTTAIEKDDSYGGGDDDPRDEEDLWDFNTKLNRLGDDHTSVCTSRVGGGGPSLAENSGTTITTLQEIEVDYEKNPTQLYLMIQAKDWTSALQRVQYYPDEAKIFVYRLGVGHDKAALRWRLLPIHAALLMAAPPLVIQALCSAYPYGAKCRDDTNDLPIHLAVRKQVDEETINILLQAYPDSIDIMNGEGQTARGLAELSTGTEHQAYYLEALQRGPLHTKITVANILSRFLCGLDLTMRTTSTTSTTRQQMIEFTQEQLDTFRETLEVLIRELENLDVAQIKKCLEDFTEEILKCTIDPANQMVDDTAEQLQKVVVEPGTQMVQDAREKLQKVVVEPGTQMVHEATEKLRTKVVEPGTKMAQDARETLRHVDPAKMVLQATKEIRNVDPTNMVFCNATTTTNNNNNTTNTTTTNNNNNTTTEEFRTVDPPRMMGCHVAKEDLVDTAKLVHDVQEQTSEFLSDAMSHASTLLLALQQSYLHHNGNTINKNQSNNNVTNETTPTSIGHLLICEASALPAANAAAAAEA
jgi:hypothetical protein